MSTGTFSMIGASRAYSLGMGKGIVACTGVIDATFGGLIRDTVLGYPDQTRRGRILYDRKDMTVASSIIGTGVYLASANIVGHGARFAFGWCGGVSSHYFLNKYNVVLPRND